MSAETDFDTQTSNKKTPSQSVVVPFIDSAGLGVGLGALTYALWNDTRNTLIRKTQTATTAEEFDTYRQQVADHHTLSTAAGFGLVATAVTYLAVKYGRALVTAAKHNLPQNRI